MVKIGSEFLNVIRGLERLIILNTYGEDVTSQYEKRVLEKLALEGVVNDVV